MPKFIVDIEAEGEDDRWYMNFMEDQLNLSAGNVSIKKIDETDIKEKKYAIELLRTCTKYAEGKLKDATVKYMNDAIDTLEKNNI